MNMRFTIRPLLPRLASCLPVLAIALVMIVYFWPQVTLKAIPFAADSYGSDLLAVNEPYLAYSAEALHEGRMPLWTSRLGGGFPQFAEGGTAFFYPVTILLYALFSPSRAFILLFPVQAFLAALFVYAYLRALGTGRWGALLAGIVYALSGYMVGHFKHVTHQFIAATLLPLLLLFAHYAFHAKTYLRTIIFSALLGAALALMLLSGSGQVTYQAILLLFLLSLAYAVRDLVASLRDRLPELFIQKRGLAELFRWLARWCLLGAATALSFLLLSAVQLLPTLELTRQASRTVDKTLEWATQLPFHPQNLRTFLQPFAFGNPAFLSYSIDTGEILNAIGLFWENIGYVGILPLLLAFIAIPLAVRHRSFPHLCWIGIGIVGLTFVMGKYLPLYEWFWLKVPGFSSFRVPGRYLWWVTLSLSVLAGYACDAFLAWLAAHPRLRLSSLTLRLIGLSILAAVVFDLSVFGYHYNAMDRLPLRAWDTVPSAVKVLKASGGDGAYLSLFAGQDFEQRMMAAGGWQNDLAWVLNNRELLPPDYALRYGLRSLDHYTPLTVARAERLRSLIYAHLFESVVVTPPDPRPTYTLRDSVLRIAAAAGVNAILSHAPLRSALLPEGVAITSTFGARLYYYPLATSLPHAYLTATAQAVPSQEASARALTDPAFAASTPVAEIDALPALTAKKMNLRQEEAREGYYRLRSETNGDALLVLNESFYPGWEARIDGVPTDIYPANLAFQAIIVPAGLHEVEFKFVSKSFQTGALISFIGWIFTFGLIIYLAIVKQTQPSMIYFNDRTEKSP